MTSLPSCYLSLPLGSTSRRKDVWNPILGRCEKRLVAWKDRLLLAGGRLAFLKSVLSSIPIYYLSLFPAHALVVKKLEKVPRDFLWSSGEDKKFHLMRWKEVCWLLKKCGLGIRLLRPFNIALLCKRLWRFGEERDRLWGRVIQAKYGDRERGWASKYPVVLDKVCLWEGIVMRTWKPRWDPHIRFMGATCEDYECLHGMQHEGRNLPRIKANLEIF